MNKENYINERRDEASSPSDNKNTGAASGLSAAAGSTRECPECGPIPETKTFLLHILHNAAFLQF